MAKLEEARAEVSKLGGFVASQTRKASALQAELKVVMEKEVGQLPAAQFVAELEAIMANTQQLLEAARANQQLQQQQLPTASGSTLSGCAGATGTAPFGAIITGPDAHSANRNEVQEGDARRMRSLSPGRGMSTATQRRLFGA